MTALAPVNAAPAAPVAEAAPKTSRYEHLNHGMSFSEAVAEASKREIWPDSGFDLVALAANVSIATIIPFALIAAFEAIVFNGAVAIINLGITALNSLLDCFPSEEAAPATPAPAQVATAAAEATAPAPAAGTAAAAAVAAADNAAAVVAAPADGGAAPANNAAGNGGAPANAAGPAAAPAAARPVDEGVEEEAVAPSCRGRVARIWDGVYNAVAGLRTRLPAVAIWG